MSGRVRRLARAVPIYWRLARWGLAPHVTTEPRLRVVQGVVIRDRALLLSVRSDLCGWELPGGTADPGERDADAIVREIREETGIEVVVERRVGDYVRSGFRPHTARVYRCRVRGGELRTSRETPVVRWFDLDAVPGTLFPWYRTPLRDALAGGEPVVRHERWGIGEIATGIAIDLRMRWSGGDVPGR